ncbi:iron-containing alcohol dehydrogenase [Psychromarinibacter sp. C21-152]|uniref:Iron-containing alcohol dehydrogenase n=1 Tax=Psychromarinibacter sediminicola TaxID=3033385 RepID=A0AAE3NMY5_9RHOB|nr:iron-containing alcohol dehydrogenase [Psychromarinibacter sediminicola]MDF0600283.1 iron-containing alcohol dehydrogenase [Psychromarinibacter sediminicola]
MDISRAITLHMPRRIEIGQGAAAKLSEWASIYQSVFVVAQPATAPMVEKLGLSGDVAVFTDVAPEPKDSDLAAALEAARAQQPALVVGLGGGSVMDVAKLVAVLWDSDQRLADVAGPNKVAKKCSDLAQVATTAGTGSEGGIRALVTNTETNAKTAVESPLMLADIAVLDPDLTMTVPPAVTAATGVDALAHCVEAFTNVKAHPLIDDYARMGMKLAGRYLKRAVEDGADAEARAGMLLASFYGGLCLGPVNTAAGHALAYPLGSHAGMPHGISNALIFPHVLAFNAPEVPGKTAEVLAALHLPQSAEPEEVLTAASGFCRDLGIDMALRAHGVTQNDLRPWAEEAHGIRRLMDNNPRDMSVDDIETIYRAAF